MYLKLLHHLVAEYFSGSFLSNGFCGLGRFCLYLQGNMFANAHILYASKAKIGQTTEYGLALWV